MKISLPILILFFCVVKSEAAATAEGTPNLRQEPEPEVGTEDLKAGKPQEKMVEDAINAEEALIKRGKALVKEQATNTEEYNKDGITGQVVAEELNIIGEAAEIGASQFNIIELPEFTAWREVAMQHKILSLAALGAVVAALAYQLK